jgi:hypothetical protein
MASNDNMIAALKRERAAYVSRGMDDRVRQVDEQLEHFGCAPEEQEPQGRTASPQETADQGKVSAKKTAAKKTASAKPPTPTGPTEAQTPPPAE